MDVNMWIYMEEIPTAFSQVNHVSMDSTSKH